MRSPIDAELLVSDLLGSWWGQQVADADVEELLGEGLVDHASRTGTPAALALLSGIAYLGTPRQATAAEKAALDLMKDDVARPAWAQRVGAVITGECWVSKDVYGDQDSIICTFSYDGDEPHALVVLIDYNLGGMAKDAWVSSQVEALVEHGRKEADENPLTRFESLNPRQARALLEMGLSQVDEARRPPVSKTFGAYHAFVRSRTHALPPGGRLPALPRFSPDRRAALAVDFLASDEAEELSDRSAAGPCADHIINYGCDYDMGRPLRISPIKVETYLLDWLPRKVMLSAAEQEAMPHVLAAWVRWASKRIGLPEQGVKATLDAVWEATAKFTDSFYDPTSLGLSRPAARRLLPDGDLEALPRRAFAFPLLEGRHSGVELSSLDPAEPADRRKLIKIEHVHSARHAGRHWNDNELDAHIDLHEEVANQLWEGQPPEAWKAAQHLLDRGLGRNEILHLLIGALEEVGGLSYDQDQLRTALRSLLDF